MEYTKVKEQNSVLKGYNMLLYFAGSMIMHEPVEECVVDFWSKGILKTLPVKSNNPRFVIAASQLRDSCEDKTVCRRMLQEDFKRLFSDSGLPLAPPLKSNYIDIPLSNGSKAENVGDFYNSYGWDKRTRNNIPDDNLGIELLFLTLLNDRYIALEDKACRREMRNEIRRFIRLHILSWLPEWSERMQEYAVTPGYKAIATLIYACCEDVFDLLDDSDPKIDFTSGLRN